MTAIDLPPGIGLLGTPLGTFHAPRNARRLATTSLVLVSALLVITWYLVSRHPWRFGASGQVVLPVAFVLFAALGFAVRRARVAITRDGVRWGWSALSFTQPASRIACAHIFRDGVALEAHRGSRWFIAARDWDRFDALVRQLRRVEIPLRDYEEGKAPLRQRLQSYGRVLDGLLVMSVVGGFFTMLWAL